MDWNHCKSLALSRFCVALFSLLLAGVVISAPWLWPALLRRPGEGLARIYTAVTWVSAVPAALVLWQLNRLLSCIGRGQVFTPGNTACLRTISWCCIAAGLVYLAGSAWDGYLLILAAAAAFVGLILRVVKNVFAEAVLLKEEHDFTI